MNDVVKNLVLWIVIAVVLLSVFHSFGDRSSTAQGLIYSDFLTQVKQGQVREVTIEGQNINGVLVSGAPFSTYSPETNNSALINFDLSVVSPATTAAGPRLEYVDTGRMSGTCTLSCHGANHVGSTYP